MPASAERRLVVVLRALGLGDLLTSLPAMLAVRRAHPDDELVLILPEWLHELALEVTGADRCEPGDELTVGPLLDRLGRPADLGIALHGRGPQSHALLAEAVRPRRMLAYRSEHPATAGGPEWSDGEHEVDRWCRLVEWYGMATRQQDLVLPREVRDRFVARLPASMRSPRPTAVVHPGTKAAARQWPPERFAAVAAWLSQRGFAVAVTGTAAERPLAQRVADLAGLHRHEAVLAGRLDLVQTLGLVAHAALVVAGDTGIGHAATSTATPAVLIFGPAPPSRWGPPEWSPSIVLWKGESGDPLAGVPSRGLLAISVAEVITALERALLRPPASDSPARDARPGPWVRRGA